MLWGRLGWTELNHRRRRPQKFDTEYCTHKKKRKNKTNFAPPSRRVTKRTEFALFEQSLINFMMTTWAGQKWSKFRRKRRMINIQETRLPGEVCFFFLGEKKYFKIASGRGIAMRGCEILRSF